MFTKYSIFFTEYVVDLIKSRLKERWKMANNAQQSQETVCLANLCYKYTLKSCQLIPRVDCILRIEASMVERVIERNFSTASSS